MLALMGMTGAAGAAAEPVLGAEPAGRAVPYGPAANGPIVFARDGDIYTADPTGQDPRPLITGVDDDAWPTFSRDGSRLLFERRSPGSPPRLMIADADGTDIVPFTDIPGDFPWSDWSPDGVHFAAEWMVDGELILQILTTDGSEPPRTLDLGGIELLELAGFRPPDGREVIFSGHPEAGSKAIGLYAIGLDGTGLRAIGQRQADASFQQLALSPDGSLVAYWNWEPNDAGVDGGYLHVRDLATGIERPVSLDLLWPGVGFAPRFSPDGSTLLFESGPHAATGNGQLVIAPIDGHVPARPIGDTYQADVQNADFSPDGRLVLQERDPGGVWLIDIATGVATHLGEEFVYPSWQRLAGIGTPADTAGSSTAGALPADSATFGQAVAAFDPPFTYSVPPEMQVRAVRDDDMVLALVEGDARGPLGAAMESAPKTGARGMLVANVTHAVTHPCPGGKRIEVGDDPSAFLDDMQVLAGLRVTDEEAGTVAGHPSVGATTSAESACDSADLHVPRIGNLSYIMLDVPSRIILTQVAGRTILVQAWAGTTDALESWLPIADGFIDSITFIDPGAGSGSSASSAARETTATLGFWTTYRGNAGRTGVATTAGPVGNPRTSWTVQTEAAITSEPAVVDGSVYIGSDDGSLYALDAADGTERWRFAAGSAVSSSPAVTDGTVYVGSADGTLFALDVQSGDEVWRSTGARDGASPAVTDGVVYTGSADGSLYAIDATIGATIWSSPLGDIASRSPAVAEGLVVVGSADSVVHAIEATTGKERWTFDARSGIISTPVIADGVVYDCAFEGDANALYALDAASGTELWRFVTETGDSVFPPIVDAGVVYAPSSDGHLYALDAADGSEHWRYRAGAGVISSPTLASSVIYLLDTEQSLHAVNALDGTSLWRLDVGAGAEKGPAIADGMAYFGNWDGTIMAVGAAGAATSASAPDSVTAPELGSVLSVSTVVHPQRASEDPGPPAWEASGPAEVTAGGPPVVDPDGNIWVPASNLDAFRIFAPDGTYLETWGTSGSGDGEFDFTRSDGSEFGDVAFAPDGTFYVADVGNHRIQQFTPERHFVRAWGSHGRGDGQFLSPNNVSVGPHRLYVGDDQRGDVQQFHPNGGFIRSLTVGGGESSLWYTAADPVSGDVAVALDSTIARYDSRGRLRSLIDPTFDQPLTVDFDEAGNLYAFGMQGPLNTFVPDSVAVIEPSGRLVWRVAEPWVLGAVTPDGTTLLFDDFETGRLRAYGSS
jgi:outer membrane protein assembly factor BamB/Tol biopolymer transport system component